MGDRLLQRRFVHIAAPVNTVVVAMYLIMCTSQQYEKRIGLY